ncbi:HU family DNA-binding protein [Phocaeicola sp.]
MATVKYSVVSKKSLLEPNADPKFYACAQSSGVQTLEDMSMVIEKNCTLTSTDIMAVLHAMDEVVRDQLCNGQIVRIGDLGYARLSLRSKGANTAERFTAEMIKQARVVFTPSAKTRRALKTLCYVKVAVQEKKKPSGSDEGEVIE